METYIKQFSDITSLADCSLSAEFNISIDKIEKAYRKFISDTFHGHKRVSFKNAVQIQSGLSLPKGTLCYKSSFNGQINLFITKKETLSTSTLIYFNIIDPAISPEYLLWFLDHKQIKDYLTCFSLGAVIVHIPVQTFNLLEIPYPKQGEITKKKTTVILQPENSKFKALISQYYQYYKESYSSENYLTAAILAGAIAETHLFVFLIDSGISPKTLKQKTLGALIDLAEAFLQNREINGFPFTDFKEVQKLRNRAVHPVINADNFQEINASSFGGFKRIIKYFGL